MEENRLKDRYVVAWDSLCEGYQCMMTEDEAENSIPLLFNSREEAIVEMFDGAYSMLENKETSELKELEVSKEKLKAMGKVWDTKDAKAMEEFLNEYPECNYNNEWVEKAEEFILNRKAFFTKDGVIITGEKL